MILVSYNLHYQDSIVNAFLYLSPKNSNKIQLKPYYMRYLTNTFRIYQKKG